MYHRNPIYIFYPLVQVFVVIIKIIHVVSSSEIHLTRLNSDSNLVDGKLAKNGSFGFHDENSTSVRSAAISTIDYIPENMHWCLKAKVSDYDESGTNDNVQFWFRFKDGSCCVTNILDKLWKDDWCGPNKMWPSVISKGCNPGSINTFCGERFLGNCNSKPLDQATSANVHVDGTNLIFFRIYDDLCVENVKLIGNSKTTRAKKQITLKGPWGYDICSNSRKEYHKQEKGCNGLEGHK